VPLLLLLLLLVAPTPQSSVALPVPPVLFPVRALSTPALLPLLLLLLLLVATPLEVLPLVMLRCQKSLMPRSTDTRNFFTLLTKVASSGVNSASPGTARSSTSSLRSKSAFGFTHIATK